MEKGQLIARGRTSEIFTWGENCILKCFYEWVPDEWITAEDTFSRKIAAANIPVPVSCKLRMGTMSLIGARCAGVIHALILPEHLIY